MDVWVPEPLYKVMPWLSILIGVLLVITTPSQFNLLFKWVAVVFFVGYGLSVLCVRSSYKGQYTTVCPMVKRKPKK